MGGVELDNVLQNFHNPRGTFRLDFTNVRLTGTHYYLRTAL